MGVLADRFISAADSALRTLAGVGGSTRPSPAAGVVAPEMPDVGKRHAAGLMRVNHAGEVCAQALYSGQALVARDPAVRAALERAASEERDHLSWCRGRLGELDSRPSILGPFWYLGSFGLGLASGLAGDRWSLGFLVETERQVEQHLAGHLERLPVGDERSRKIVEQMKLDEATHGASGEALGANELPLPVKLAMRMASRVMTRTAYWA